MVDRSATGGASRRNLLGRGAALGVAGVAAGMAGAPLAARAQAEGGKLKEILDRGKLVVGTGSTNPPWHYEDENGALIGFDLDMASYLARGLFGLDDATLDNPEELAKRLEIVVEASDARIPNLTSGKVDIVCQFMTVTPARALEVEFTIPYYREAVALLIPAGADFSSAAELTGRGAKVAILENSFAEDLVRQGVSDAEVSTFDSVANSILALDSGRVDATAIDLSTAQFKTSQSPDKYMVSTDSWSPQTYAFAVAPGDQRWLNWVNTCLHELLVGVDFAYYQKAFQNRFGVELAPPPAGFPVEFK
jgi:polar amino acid transport system substrate-binding protein